MTQRISDERLAFLISDEKAPRSIDGVLKLDLRDARAQLAERDQRIAKLEAALREIWGVMDDADVKRVTGEWPPNARCELNIRAIIEQTRTALSPPPAAGGGEK